MQLSPIRSSQCLALGGGGAGGGGGWAIGGTVPETSEIWTHICSCYNFFLLSSV